MASTVEHIRKQSCIDETREDKGLKATITVRVYDNRKIYVNDIPVGGEDDRWLTASRVVIQLLEELQLRSSRRLRERHPEPAAR